MSVMSKTEEFGDIGTINSDSTIQKIAEIYDISVNCEYKKYETDTKYREEFLKVFKLKSFVEDQLIDSQCLLRESLEHERRFLRLIEKAAGKVSTILMDPARENDKDFGITMLFSFEYFEMFHNCIKSYVKNNGTIKQDFIEHYNNLLQLLEK